MVRQLAFTAALLAATVSFPSSGLLAQAPRRCLHGPTEQPAQQTRRNQALDPTTRRLHN